MKQPNVPMNHTITTCRHKVDKEKFDSGWDRIWGNGIETVFNEPQEEVVFTEDQKIVDE